MNTTQTETIVWHKYPEEKLTFNNWYLVDVGEDGIDCKYWSPDDWHYKQFRKVVAWAEMPKGWKE